MPDPGPSVTTRGRLGKPLPRPQPETGGITLIADYSDNRVLEIDDDGEQVFVLEEIYGAWDVESLANGNLLITEFAVNRVGEYSRDGEQVWTYVHRCAGTRGNSDFGCGWVGGDQVGASVERIRHSLDAQ